MTATPLRLLRCLGLAGLLAGALPAPAATNSESAYAARSGFTFALLGGLPARDGDEALVAQVFAQLGRETDLAIHTGDIKGREERCDDATYSRRHQLLDGSPVPLVLTPGKNDWAECDRKAAGQFSPVERLARLRELFFESDYTLGAITLDLQRQSETVRFRDYPENARWEYGDILFVTLNVPGNRNNYRTGAGRNGEFEERDQANTAWLGHAFATAQRLKARGIVVVFSADPHFDRPARQSGGADPYGTLKNELAKQAADYRGKVLIVHGAEGRAASFKPDHPLKHDGRTLEHVTRVKAHGQGRPATWIKVSVEPGDKNVFRLEALNTVPRPPQPR